MVGLAGPGGPQIACFLCRTKHAFYFAYRLSLERRPDAQFTAVFMRRALLGANGHGPAEQESEPPFFPSLGRGVLRPSVDSDTGQ